jgi:hypothetical protein
MEGASPKPLVPTAALVPPPSAGAKLCEPKPTQPETGAAVPAVPAMEERGGILACWGALLVGEGLEDGDVEAAAETVPRTSPFSFTSLRP